MEITKYQHETNLILEIKETKLSVKFIIYLFIFDMCLLTRIFTRIFLKIEIKKENVFNT